MKVSQSNLRSLMLRNCASRCSQAYQLLLLLLFVPCLAFSQEESSAGQHGKKQSRPAYVEMSFGLNLSGFRDFATSPLIYSGIPFHFSAGHLDLDEKRESSIRFSYNFGDYKNKFNDQDAISKVKTMGLNYRELFELRSLSTSNLNVKIGMQFNATVNLRENEILLNNGTGVDIPANLFTSIKGTLNLNEKRTLSGILNLGAINSSYRNGFVYSGQSALTNDGRFFDEYQLKVFRGYRFNLDLDYTCYLENKNAIQLSYRWDAYRTGGNFDEFEMATHTIAVALLFNLR